MHKMISFTKGPWLLTLLNKFNVLSDQGPIIELPCPIDQVAQDDVDIDVDAYMQKTCDVAEKAILAKKKLRKKCVNRDKM